MTANEELHLMKTNPKVLFDLYLQMLSDGIALDDSQKSKFEYLKKLFVVEE